MKLSFISLIDKMIELGLGKKTEDDDEEKRKVINFMLDNSNYRNRTRRLKC